MFCVADAPTSFFGRKIFPSRKSVFPIGLSAGDIGGAFSFILDLPKSFRPVWAMYIVRWKYRAVAVVGDDAGIVHAFVEEKALAFSPKFALIFVAYGGIYRFDGNFSVGFHLFDYGVPFRCLHFDEPFGCFIGLVVPVKASAAISDTSPSLMTGMRAGRSDSLPLEL